VGKGEGERSEGSPARKQGREEKFQGGEGRGGEERRRT
jgi:hypothetical protein